MTGFPVVCLTLLLLPTATITFLIVLMYIAREHLTVASHNIFQMFLCQKVYTSVFTYILTHAWDYSKHCTSHRVTLEAQLSIIHVEPKIW